MSLREREPAPRDVPPPEQPGVPSQPDKQVRRVHRHPIARLKRRLARI